ncbi:MAG TPA: hypothetical protein VNY83_07780 [Solirubrobacterales bacterium]|jgi:hypothetical protein|nr:hypothetical protein [Solirubrobacterales bacterium]
MRTRLRALAAAAAVVALLGVGGCGKQEAELEKANSQIEGALKHYTKEQGRLEREEHEIEAEHPGG